MNNSVEDDIPKDIPNLPEGWKILYWKGESAIVQIHKDDLERVRLLKLPAEVREYLKQKQSKYRENVRQKLRTLERYENGEQEADDGAQ